MASECQSSWMWSGVQSNPLSLTIWEPACPGPGADTKHLKQIYLFSAPTSAVFRPSCSPGTSQSTASVLLELWGCALNARLTQMTDWISNKYASNWTLTLEMSDFHLVIYAHSGNGSTICLVCSWFTDHNGKGCDGTYISELSMNEVFWIKK